MLDDIELDDHVRALITDLMIVMYEHGVREVHMGGMMRMLGVDNETAAEHDDEVVVLNEEFAKYVKQINEPRPGDQTLH
jgi:hypothetical protein